MRCNSGDMLHGCLRVIASLTLGGLRLAENRLNLLLALGAGYHEYMPAALAAKPEIRSAALNKHSVAAASRVDLLHDQYISDSDVHLRSRSFHLFLSCMHMLLYHVFGIIAINIWIFLCIMRFIIYPSFPEE